MVSTSCRPSSIKKMCQPHIKNNHYLKRNEPSGSFHFIFHDNKIINKKVIFK